MKLRRLRFGSCNKILSTLFIGRFDVDRAVVYWAQRSVSCVIMDKYKTRCISRQRELLFVPKVAFDSEIGRLQAGCLLTLLACCRRSSTRTGCRRAGWARADARWPTPPSTRRRAPCARCWRCRRRAPPPPATACRTSTIWRRTTTSRRGSSRSSRAR